MAVTVICLCLDSHRLYVSVSCCLHPRGESLGLSLLLRLKMKQKKLGIKVKLAFGAANC